MGGFSNKTFRGRFILTRTPPEREERYDDDDDIVKRPRPCLCRFHLLTSLLQLLSARVYGGELLLRRVNTRLEPSKNLSCLLRYIYYIYLLFIIILIYLFFSIRSHSSVLFRFRHWVYFGIFPYSNRGFHLRGGCKTISFNFFLNNNIFLMSAKIRYYANVKNPVSNYASLVTYVCVLCADILMTTPGGF